MRRIFAGGQRNASIEIYRLLLAVLLVAVLLPMALAGIYNRPQADDYAQPYPVYVAYQETGSLLETLKAAVQEMLNIFNSRSGVFFFDVSVRACAKCDQLSPNVDTPCFEHAVCGGSVFSCFALLACHRQGHSARGHGLLGAMDEHCAARLYSQCQ